MAEAYEPAGGIPGRRTASGGEPRHGQPGIRAITMAVVTRMGYRMPYEPITQLSADLPGIGVGKGATRHYLVGVWADVTRDLRATPIAK